MWSISNQSTVMGRMGVNSSAGTATIELLHVLILAHLYKSLIDYVLTVPCTSQSSAPPMLMLIRAQSQSVAKTAWTRFEYHQSQRSTLQHVWSHQPVGILMDLHWWWLLLHITEIICVLKSIFLAATIPDLHLKKEKNMCYIVINTNI